MRPPLVSVYARYPEDMRLMRSMLGEFGYKTFGKKKIKALYIGTAFGEDFFSWIPVAWGTNVEIEWYFIEIDDKARKHCFEEALVYIHGTYDVVPSQDFTKEINSEYDIIIANHVWKNIAGANKNSKDNINGLRNIIAAKPKILIIRDVRYEKQPFKACLQEYTMVRPFVFRRKVNG